MWDCASRACWQGTCVAASNGAACTASNLCASGVCAGGRCAAPTCSDGVRNGAESDTDCGAACGADAKKCRVGAGCVLAEDCASGVCGGGGKCASNSCSDGVKNGKETDTDCGGPDCPGCLGSRTCYANGDCLSAECVY